MWLVWWSKSVKQAINFQYVTVTFKTFELFCVECLMNTHSSFFLKGTSAASQNLGGNMICHLNTITYGVFTKENHCILSKPLCLETLLLSMFQYLDKKRKTPLLLMTAVSYQVLYQKAYMHLMVTNIN